MLDDHETMKPSQRCQSQKTTHFMFPRIKISRMGKRIQTQGRLVVAVWGAGVEEEWGGTANGDGVSFGGDENVPQWILAMVLHNSVMIQGPLNCVLQMGQSDGM